MSFAWQYSRGEGMPRSLRTLGMGKSKPESPMNRKALFTVPRISLRKPCLTVALAAWAIWGRTLLSVMQGLFSSIVYTTHCSRLCTLLCTQQCTCMAMAAVSEPLGVAPIPGGRRAMNLPSRLTMWPTSRQGPWPRLPDQLSALRWGSSVLDRVR